MPFAEVVARGQAARDHALVLVQRSRALHEASRALMDECRRNQQRRCRRTSRESATAPWSTSDPSSSSTSSAVAVEQVDARRPAGAPSFELEGLIEDRPVRAAFEQGTLSCDPLLLTHAELVVALGDSFVCGPSSQSRTAALDGDPFVVLATLMRAMRVTRVEVAM